MRDLAIERDVGEADLVALAELVAKTLLEPLGEDPERPSTMRSGAARRPRARYREACAGAQAGSASVAIGWSSIVGRRRAPVGSSKWRSAGGSQDSHATALPAVKRSDVQAWSCVASIAPRPFSSMIMPAVALGAVAQPHEMVGDRGDARMRLGAQDTRLVGEPLHRQVAEVVGHLAEVPVSSASVPDTWKTVRSWSTNALDSYGRCGSGTSRGARRGGRCPSAGTARRRDPSGTGARRRSGARTAPRRR